MTVILLAVYFGAYALIMTGALAIWQHDEDLEVAEFIRENKLLCMYVGGLNFRIEHHLSPKVCSIHHPAISSIVEATANEFGVPYHLNQTFLGAVASHYRVLKKYGWP